ncbi:hypothetical protein FIBSPDRAFT_856317 [Athelia psychrophila]|uniref:Uncharacterized protein n=1 Tax=Athelia psychrophila TaxID=1759441 RepID=A0A166NFT6_9AGAM|nr:hypothetical protein FIBSPDRAFT_856317 [Fibularhizoctonia sp. CBS 109695]
MWDAYTAEGVHEAGEVDWAHIKPFAAAFDRAQEQLVVVMTVAMPSAPRRRLTGKPGASENDNSRDEEGEADP